MILLHITGAGEGSEGTAVVQMEQEEEGGMKAEGNMQDGEDDGGIGVEIVVVGGNKEVDVIEAGETSGTMGNMEVVLDSQV